ncbi:FG-GAP repeat domain-containing protein [Streptomyces sp. NPDC093089]|uniref:FG-GAP repeat domain-containing protein n=1 Tax=Streptomyces sp. NPDC093089 TaxID=3366024 RepID=UPI003825C6F5
MNHTRTSRRRLAATVAVVLFVTAGTLAAPAVAAVPGSGPVAAGTAADGVPAHFPVGGTLFSAGPTGFATAESGPTQVTYRWTRYSDGATTVFPARIGVGAGTDVVKTVEGTTHKLYDMSTGADPVSIDVGGPLASYRIRATSRTTLAMTAPNATGGADLHLVDNPAGTVRDRTVPGFPADAVLDSVVLSAPDTLVVQYSGTVDGSPHRRVALVDVASGTITRDRESPAPGALTNLTVSDTRLAWVEASAPDWMGNRNLSVAVAGWDDAPDTEPEHLPVGRGAKLVIDLVGDWVTYAVPNGIDYAVPNPLYSLTARSLKTGETFPLLDHVVSSTIGPDDTQVVRGGSLTENEGLYRVAVSASGKPETTLLATTGEPTATGIVGTDIPTVVDLSKSGGTAALRWSLNRWSPESGITLTHVASGRTWSSEYRVGTADRWVDWNGTFTNGVAAFNGEYAWRITATPGNGIGPAAEQTGRFTLTNPPAPHDFSDSGTPDLLFRDHTGRLKSYDVRQLLTNTVYSREISQLGTGWQIYNRLVAPGDLGGTPHADVIARDYSGLLWLYPGTGHSLGARVKIGTGWQVYDKIVGGSDLTGDGRPDVLATDTAGGLWLYPATGNYNAPLGARKQIGTGWGVYNQITATGNIAGAPAGDLVARDKDGALWQYLGKGDGTFAPRTKIGTGWNTYRDVIGIGDTNRDGLNDLLAVDHADVVRRYPGTGDWRRPLGPARELDERLGDASDVRF